jgi:hypothetical protein
VTAPLGALAVDVNRDGWHDFLLREQPYLPYANVGSNCDVWRYNSPYHARLYVRPPIVWGLRSLGRQRVAWRARFYDVGSGQVRAIGNWVYATVVPFKSTIFGGGPDAGGGVMITHNQYWQGGQYYDHLAGDSDRIRASIDARWYNSRKRVWTRATLRVQWVITTTNRSIGRGQTGPYSTPVRNYTC